MRNKMENKIYVITHKKIELSDSLKAKGYELLSVGGPKGNDGVCDNSGDNISSKNANYCELTGAYWIWKNIDNEIKGFCHYRRFFTKKTLKYNENKVLSAKEICNILKAKPNVVIMPERKYYNISATELYLRCGYQKDLDTTREVIFEKYPEYVKTYDKLMKCNYGYITNMMIAKKELYDAYHAWLFDILFEVEKRTDISNYTKAEARIYGYISERLLGVWLIQNNIETVEFQSINTEESSMRYVLYRLAVNMGLYKGIKTSVWKLKRTH